MHAKRVRCVCVCVCVLPYEYLHRFLTALPWPRLSLILSCLASASSMLPRSRENCITHITSFSCT